MINLQKNASSDFMNRVYVYVIGMVFLVLFIKLFIYYFSYIPDHLELYKDLMSKEQLINLGNVMNKIVYDIGVIVFVLLIVNVVLISYLYKVTK